MNKYLAFTPFVQPVPVDDKRIMLLAEHEYFVLEDPLVVGVAQCLLGEKQSVDDIVFSLGALFSEDDVLSMITDMMNEGFIEEWHSPTRHPPLTSSSFQRDGSEKSSTACDASQQACVTVLSYGVDPSQVCAALDDYNIGLHSVYYENNQWVGFDRSTPAASPGYSATSSSFSQRLEETVFPKIDLAVVVVNDFLHPFLPVINQVARRGRHPWFLLKPCGRSVWMTPFLPGDHACYACLAERVRANRRGATFAKEVLGLEWPFASTASRTIEALPGACRRAAEEIMRWFTEGKHSSLEGLLLTLDPALGNEKKHVISQLRHCPDCGILLPPSPPPAPALTPRQKLNVAEGGSRSVSAEEAFNRYKHLIDSVTGVARDLFPFDSSASNLVCAFGLRHTLSSHPDCLEALQEDELFHSTGKGRTPAQARASALFEALERFSGIWRETVYRKRASYKNLGDQAIHPNRLLLFSNHQYATRETWNAACPHPELHVPQRCDPEEEIEWVSAWSLTHEEYQLVPAAYAYFDYPLNGTSFCIADSNGCAAGLTLEEALLQGSFELIERDAIGIWWNTMVRRPAVDLASFQDTYFQQLKQHYLHDLDRDLWVLDITTDLDIPVFVAVSRQRSDMPDWLLGFGCHWNPQIAITRALTEVNQLLPLMNTQRDPDAGPFILPAWMRSASAQDLPYLMPNEACAPRRYADYTYVAGDDLLIELTSLIHQLRSHDLELLFIDQTHPDIGVYVVKTLCPGLQHHWKRLGGRRLYQVPKVLGWRADDYDEHTMNRTPLTL